MVFTGSQFTYPLGIEFLDSFLFDLYLCLKMIYYANMVINHF